MKNVSGYRQWVTPAPEAVFLLVHGLGAHAGRWEALAGFFLKKGISSYAPELSGAPGYYDKILRIYDIASGANPSKKIYLVGESLGALESFLLAIRHPKLFEGLICLSPAFASRMKLPPLEYLKIFIALIYDRKRYFKIPFSSNMCTRDTDYSDKMDSDERERRSANAVTLFNIMVDQLMACILKARLKVPVLFLLSGNDKLVDPSAARNVFTKLTVCDKTLIEYPDMYHALSIDLGKEKVFEDMAEWVKKRELSRRIACQR
ncbi:MAG: alpha/beta fold hydrolase [Candidatus Omnitrophica bacterium]|nr:alpha/beta fold hydrolase [Candidatus Omnitrophota bacterium]